MNFSSSFFQKNRSRFFQSLPKDSITILFSNNRFPKNGDQFFPFRQQSDLYYLSGIKQEETTLVLYKDTKGECHSFLLILKPNWKLETWEGKKLHKQEATNISGIEAVFWNAYIPRLLNKLIGKKTQIFVLGAEAFIHPSKMNLKHVAWAMDLKKQFPKNKILSARSLLNALRLIKSVEEIEMIKQAIAITNFAFESVMQLVKPNMKEFEIEAEISYLFRKLGANGHAYEPIIASGLNACSLHYIENKSVLKDGDLLLMDFGADVNYYAADLSRTIPVSGRFSSRQKELYQLVLDVQKKATSLFVPGSTINKINSQVNQWMGESLKRHGIIQKGEELSLYYPHGTSHFLGIDVHDVGTKDTPFQKGMVLTCEPGLYIPKEGLGIRIENDILIDDQAIDLMTDTKREIKDIELYMSRNN